MTDRERLIDLMIEAKRTEPETGSFAEHLADYLLEHGVIVLPCKVGDIVYVPYKDSQTIEEKRVKSISHVINEFENSMEFNANIITLFYTLTLTEKYSSPVKKQKRR